jgi:hypothetical protein
MAVLGIGGKLLLKRAAPEPFLIADSTLDAGNNLYTAWQTGYWNGDHVSVDCLPTSTGPFPPRVSGYGSYLGSKWFLGPNRSQISSNADNFYKTAAEAYPDGDLGDASQFYSREGDTSGGDVIPSCGFDDYYIHIDSLGRVSFYLDRCAALLGSLTNRINLFSVAGTLTVSPYGTADYLNAIWDCVTNAGDFSFSDAQDTVTLISICADAPSYRIPEGNPNDETFSYNNADLLPRGPEGQVAPYWQQLCDIAQWSLELNAPSVETTSVSEKFGNAVKSLVTGGGSAEFLIDRKCYANEKDNGLALMQLLMMTEKGCEATAQFWMVDREANYGVDNGSIPGGLYYEANILVTASAVNLRPTEIVAGTVQFVTTEDIKLLVSS